MNKSQPATARHQHLQRGLTQRDVAAKANVGKQTVDNLEHGTGSVTVRKLQAVALAPGLDIPTAIRNSVR